MKLYNYQQIIITKLKQTLLNGYNSPVIVLGCGGGKSFICADIVKSATLKKNAVLFLVHRIELIEQITETFINYGVDMSLCDIAMVQSAKKLNREYKLIITDESHHNTCKTYQNIYDKYPNVKRINVTATPCRTDGRGLGETCDYLIETVSTKWLIKNNYLSPYEYYTITLDGFNPETLKKFCGEYEDVTDLLDKPRIYGDIFKHYKTGKKAICYCSSIKHSINTAQEFNNRGINAAHIDGNTPKEQRKQIINDFRNGKIMVLCNYALISEGFDVPDCDMVLLLRKTTSLGLFIQMTMRCMRFKENKTAIILDFCGNAYEHGLPDDDRKWTLDSKIKMVKNISAEPDIIARSCKNCFKTYAGNNRICPYCEFDNGKTKKEIEQDKQAELERIIELKKFIKAEHIKTKKRHKEYIKTNIEKDIKKLKEKDIILDLVNLKTIAEYRLYAEQNGYDIKWAYIKYKCDKKLRRKI